MSTNKKSGAEPLSKKEKIDALIKQWDVCIRTSSHFNDMIQKLRQMTATYVAAIYVASLTSLSITENKTISIIIILSGMIFLVGCFFVDRHYYYRMLVISVQETMRLESDPDLECKITTRISERVKEYQAKRYSFLYYLSFFIIGIIFIALMVCFL